MEEDIKQLLIKLLKTVIRDVILIIRLLRLLFPFPRYPHWFRK